jgi:hypothetical protein
MRLRKYRIFSEVKLPVHKNDVAKIQAVVLGFALLNDPTMELRNVWLNRGPAKRFYRMRIPNEGYQDIVDYINDTYYANFKGNSPIGPNPKNPAINMPGPNVIALPPRYDQLIALDKPDDSVFDVASDALMS